MKKYLLIYAVCVTAVLLFSHRRQHTEIQRLAQNQKALTSEITHYRTRSGQEAASAQALRLRCSEFEALRAADAEQIRRLGIRLRHVEASARHATTTSLSAKAPLLDTIILRDTLYDTVRHFRWHDPWITVEGILTADSAACHVESRDTLHQILHRIPRRFLFIRWGTKALRQEIVTANPHTHIAHTEYIKIER